MSHTHLTPVQAHIYEREELAVIRHPVLSKRDPSAGTSDLVRSALSSLLSEPGDLQPIMREVRAV